MLLTYFFCILFSQQGKYNRKSISSLGVIFIKDELKQVDTFYENLINSHIEVPRFDNNVIPNNILENFLDKSQNLKDIASIEKVLKETVLNRIVQILNDPDVQNQRGLALKNESDFESFASTKGKSLGLNLDEIKILMNSAYLYMPFIKYTETTKKRPFGFWFIPRILIPDILSYKIKGGIIWWKISNDANGNASIKKISEYQTKTKSSSILLSHPVMSFVMPLYTSNRKKLEKRLSKSASEVFFRNIGTLSKEMAGFKITGQIIEAKNRLYKVSIGEKEGLKLDDGYFVGEYYKNKKGDVELKKTGFSKVFKINKGSNNKDDLTILKQSIGKKVNEGSIVFEHPRTNILLGFRYGESSINIPKTIFSHVIDYNLKSSNIFKENIKTTKNYEMIIAYNISSIVNKPQTFLTLSFGDSDIDLDRKYINSASVKNNFIISHTTYTLGLSRKFGLGRSNFGYGFSLGSNQLSMNGDIYLDTDLSPGFYDFTFQSSNITSILSTEYEFLINPDLSFNLEISAKVTQGPSIPNEFHIKDKNPLYNDSERLPINKGTKSDWPNIMKGTAFKIGLNYHPKTLPFNIEGWFN
ncbi:hypothetical protein N9I45_00275 [bacterium]|nr:hypothetical protein [bacterium]